VAKGSGEGGQTKRSGESVTPDGSVHEVGEEVVEEVVVVEEEEEEEEEVAPVVPSRQESAVMSP